jgi:hypothetical protein
MGGVKKVQPQASRHMVIEVGMKHPLRQQQIMVVMIMVEAIQILQPQVTKSHK